VADQQVPGGTRQTNWRGWALLIAIILLLIFIAQNSQDVEIKFSMAS